MEKKQYESRPLGIEEVSSIGTRTAIIRFNITEVGGGFECDESQFQHKDKLTEDDRPTLIAFLVRERYTADQMEAIINNYLADPTGEKALREFEAMQAWRTESKSLAAQVIAELTRPLR